MKMIQVTDTTTGRVALSVDGFGTQVIVEPLDNENAYVEVWDEAGLSERQEKPMDEAIAVAQLYLFRTYRKTV
jgi:hypothetical protein